MSTTVIGKNEVGTIATTDDGFLFYLTACCEASAKGSSNSPTSVCCRACYAPIDPALGGVPTDPRPSHAQTWYKCADGFGYTTQVQYADPSDVAAKRTANVVPAVVTVPVPAPVAPAPAVRRTAPAPRLVPVSDVAVCPVCDTAKPVKQFPTKSGQPGVRDLRKCRACR